jgi:hypothetical protein
MTDDRVTSAGLPTLGSETTGGTGASRRLAARPAGWGADLAPRDRPAEPMERRPARLDVPWHVPEPQRPRVEILTSVERPGITPVFGTTQPPHGLSGTVRRHAFRYSESDLRHWLLLLAADRIDMGEGLLDDLRSGRIPNVPAETGLRAELRHNPRGAARKAGFLLAGATFAYLAYRASRRR